MIRFNFEWLIPKDTSRATKDKRNRLMAFVEWTNQYDINPDTLDLIAYREFLETERKFKPTTIRVHLATVRGRLKELLEGDRLNELLRGHWGAGEELKEYSDGLRTRFLEVLNQDKGTSSQGSEWPRNLMLTEEEIQSLLDQLNIETLLGLRDAAIITLMIATGIRENEVVALNTTDLRQKTENGELALHVPSGTGCTERLIPYHKMAWVLEIVDTWMGAAQITDGPVFRGLYKTGEIVRPNRLTGQTVEYLLKNYPIARYSEELEILVVRPLDIRHAYARYMYLNGLKIETIQGYLGLKRRATAFTYLGSIRHEQTDHHHYFFDLAKLDYWDRRFE